MLGRLLSTAASTLNPAAYAARNSAVLESVTEEEHTSGLLFPDASLLRCSNTHAYPLQTSFTPNASTAGAYDDRGGLELDVIKDFRVILAQNALGDRDEPCILLDTRAPSDSAPQGLGLDPQLFETSAGRRSRVPSISKHSRRDSIHVPLAPTMEATPSFQAVRPRKPPAISPGAFSRPRGRSSTFSPALGVSEFLPNRLSADSTDSGLLNCIFGSSAFSYRGSSTKMHVLSTDCETASGPAASSPHGTDTFVARTVAPRGSLARAYSSGAQSTSSCYFPDRVPEIKPSSKVTVLITRMFSVNLPDSHDAPLESYEYATIDFQENGYPFSDTMKRRKIKEKKTPMYAVAITIQIPFTAKHAGRPISRPGTHAPESLRPAGSMSVSLDSDPRWSRAFLDDHFSTHSQLASLDDRIDILVDHWDVITRTLSRLETLAGKEILALLKKVDALSGLQPKPIKAPNMQRTNQTIVQLPANILADHSKLREEVLLSSQRICTALRIPRVITCQSRWGVWREEARLIARVLGDKEHSFFFLVLITAFLGNHTEWLNSLGPDWYRRRHYLQQKAQQDGELIISNRTVIISPDKMTARRLIFLLAAFLPAKQRFEILAFLNSGKFPGVRPLSQSPPSVPILRQESLRRTINRRARARRLHVDGSENHERSVSASSAETAHQSPDDVGSMDFGESPFKRRDSDARSIRTTNFPIYPNDMRLRKSSAATASTTTPSTAVPVPHFTSRHNRRPSGGFNRLTANGSDSPASANLLQTLRRSESSNRSSESSPHQASIKWGNLLSGLWNSRQEPSSSRHRMAEPFNTMVRGVPEDPHGHSEQSSTSDGHLLQKADEPVTEDESKEPVPSDNITIPPSSAHQISDQDQHGSLSSIDQTKDFPLKLSVRPEDGVVDVHLPLPGFVSLSSSGDSTATSPKKARTSITSVDAIASIHSSNSNPGFPSRDGDGPDINVAGWLKNFHEDFLLQAVKPYNNLEADIKRAMTAEATPHAYFAAVDSETVSTTEKWVDVATTLVADTRTCAVKRLRLRRKIQAGGMPYQTGTASPEVLTARQLPETPSSTTNFISNATRHRNDSTNTVADLTESSNAEEQFIEEPVMDLDSTLIDAVERVLVQSGQSSLTHSRATSPHRNHRSEDRMREDSNTRHGVVSTEVPRGECRKMVLGALEEVVRSVTAEHCREDMDVELGLAAPSAGRGRKKGLGLSDNTLREGIRKWLLDVEEVC